MSLDRRAVKTLLSTSWSATGWTAEDGVDRQALDEAVLSLL